MSITTLLIILLVVVLIFALVGYGGRGRRW